MDDTSRRPRRSRPHQEKPGGKAGHGKAFTIGRDNFERISAVEGIRPTKEGRARTAEFDRKGLSPEDRIRAIIEAYRPKR